MNDIKLRDYFAAKAMQAYTHSIIEMSYKMLGNAEDKEKMEELIQSMMNDIPSDSYVLADQMIKESEK